MQKVTGIASLVAALATVVVWAASVPAAVTTTHSGWTWGSPRPQGNPLSDVDFAGGTGYAAGSYGTLLRTTDGGTSWSGLRTGTRELLGRVRVIDAGMVVAGGECTLLRSDDGGATFRRLRFSSGSSCSSGLTAFDFPSSDVGFLFRENGAVLRTQDGGRTFAGRTGVPGVGSGFSANDALFTGANNGFVVSGNDQTTGRIHRTSNGGSSWDEVGTAGRSLRGITFSSATRGYAVGDGGTVLRSDDGGATWAPKPNGFGGNNLMQIRCTTVDMCVVSFEGGDRVLFTNDGFDTLNPVVPTGAGGVAINAVGVSSATRAVAVGTQGATFLSDDGGQTFSRNGETIPGTYTRLRATNASVAHAAGGAGAVARTTDGGQTWTALGVPTSNQIVDVSFPTSDLGYALDSAGQLFRTDNGGGSWAITGGGGQARAIAASSDGLTVLLIGPTGVRRSANGGEQFDTVDDSDVSSAKLISGSYNSGTGVLTLFAFGSKALVFSADGGRTWTTIKRPSRSKIVDVDFTDSKRGWVLTSDGRVWRTTNRGKNWAESLAHGTAGAYAIDFGDSKNGWVLLESFGGESAGWVLRTTDGGASWRPQLIDSVAMGRHGLESPAANAGFALNNASYSELFATDSGGDAGTASKISLKSKTKRISRSTRVEVTGSISPSVAGATVQVAVRSASSGSWKRTVVQTSSEGKFKASFRIGSTSYFVAQWAGDATRNGDGSSRLTITRR